MGPNVILEIEKGRFITHTFQYYALFIVGSISRDDTLRTQAVVYNIFRRSEACRMHFSINCMHSLFGNFQENTN